MKTYFVIISRLTSKVSIALLGMTLMLTACKIQYTGEEFSLKKIDTGKWAFKVKYKNFGTGEHKSYLRGNDLENLKEIFQNKEHAKKAKAVGIDILAKRLEFIDYRVNGFVEGTAKSYESVFNSLDNYDLIVEDMIYVMPKNGTVARAVLSEGGEITIKNNDYAFAWPLDTEDISFTASYTVKGSSFKQEIKKQFKN